MKSRATTIIAGFVLVVALTAVAIGFNSPDGSVGPSAAPTPTAAAPSDETPEPEPEPAPEPAPDSQAIAPASVQGPWPGRPAATTTDGDRVDWCPAVHVTASSEAERLFGADGVRAAACHSVSFVFDIRYSRLSLPHQEYRDSDFDTVRAALTESTKTRTFPSRITAVIASPRSASARSATGLVLLDGPRAGAGREFFGPPWSDEGYRDRAVWINPTWSTVAVSVDRGKSRPRLVTSFDAAAAVPVWNPREDAADQMSIETTARFVLAGTGADWLVDSWTLDTSGPRFSRLAVSD